MIKGDKFLYRFSDGDLTVCEYISARLPNYRPDLDDADRGNGEKFKIIHNFVPPDEDDETAEISETLESAFVYTGIRPSGFVETLGQVTMEEIRKIIPEEFV